MSVDFEDDQEEQDKPEEEEIDWLQYAQREEQDSLRPLDGKDYIALFIASCQTIFLPIVILVIVLLAFNFWLQIAAG